MSKHLSKYKRISFTEFVCYVIVYDQMTLYKYVAGLFWVE